MFKTKMKALLAPLRKPWVRKTGNVFLFCVKWTLLTGILFGFLAGGAVFGYVSAVLKDEPVRSHDEIAKRMGGDAQTGFVYFRDDTVVGQLRSEEDRRPATLDEIPSVMQQAVLAIEDAKFYEHSGIDLNGILRAAGQKLLNEPIQTGGSTITQQLARRVFLNLDREMTRKIKEIALALRLERQMSKEEILTAYLNKVPYGNGASGYNLYGIKAAAKGIFNIDDLTALNVAQCAYLAGIPQQPSNFSNFTSRGQYDEDNIKKAIVRQRLVLKRMLDEKLIDESKYEEALKFDIRGSLSQPMEKAYNTYPYLMIETELKASEILLSVQNPKLVRGSDEYREALRDTQEELLRGGYKVYTTIDKEIYDSMQNIAKNDKNFSPTDDVKGLEQVGAVLMDNRSGEILGMIEGRGFDKEQYNHATRATRQPGSTMKPIAAYIPAMEKGAIQPGGIIDDSPIILKDWEKGFHIPENWNNRFQGLVTARYALAQSLNIPAIKLYLNEVGIEEAWRYANEMGITTITKNDYHAQTGVIGGMDKGVSVEEMTNAYATIANHGSFTDAHMIRKIVDADGRTIFEQKNEPKTVFSEQTAFLMTDMMKNVLSEGTGTHIKKVFKHYGKIPAVGKTGSTQNDGDAWFMGYTPDLTLGVWAGYDESKHKLSKATGGTMRAMNIWALVMDSVIDGKPELFQTKEFKRPKNIVEMTVSSVSGKLPSELVLQAGKTHSDLFNRKFIPLEVDDVMVPMKFITFNGVNYVPNPATPDDFLQEKVVIRRKESISSLLKKIEELMAKLPAKERKPIERFRPKDAENDAPTEADPRTDDGAVPAAPTNLILTGTPESARLSFTGSPNPDVVGYRLYRSLDGANYQVVGGTVVLTGAETMFKDLPLPGTLASYAVTAVDVAGKESPLSAPVAPAGTPSGPQPGTSPDPGKNGGDAGGGAGEGADQEAAAVPSPPEELKAESLGPAVRLTWRPGSADDQNMDYLVYFSPKLSGPYRLVGSSGGATEYTDMNGLEKGFYRVTAVNAEGESNYSKPASVRDR